MERPNIVQRRKFCSQVPGLHEVAAAKTNMVFQSDWEVILIKTKVRFDKRENNVLRIRYDSKLHLY